jgi:hypothetical protein
MSKKTLTFEGDDAILDFKLAVHAGDMMGFIEDFEETLRGLYKYSEKQETTWEEVRGKWFDLKEQYDIPSV